MTYFILVSEFLTVRSPGTRRGGQTETFLPSGGSPCCKSAASVFPVAVSQDVCKSTQKFTGASVYDFRRFDQSCGPCAGCLSQVPLDLRACFQASEQSRLYNRADCLASIPLPFVRPAILPFVSFLVRLRSAVSAAATPVARLIPFPVSRAAGSARPRG